MNIKASPFISLRVHHYLTIFKKEWKRGVNSEDLWVYCHKWGGVKRKHRVKSNAEAGSTPVDLWGVPMTFAESDDDRNDGKQQELIPQAEVVEVEPVITPNDVDVPDEF